MVMQYGAYIAIAGIGLYAIFVGEIISIFNFMIQKAEKNASVIAKLQISHQKKQIHNKEIKSFFFIFCFLIFFPNFLLF